MQDRMLGQSGRSAPLIFLRNQVVNLDRVAEIALRPGGVTICFGFARVRDPGARLMLSLAEAEPLRRLMQHARTELPNWVAVADRLINLELVATVMLSRDQITVVPALPDSRGGPLPRIFPWAAAGPLLAYFERSNAFVPTNGPGWVEVGEHMVNLGLVSNTRFTTNHVQVVFAGLPHFTRSFSYADAGPLLERLQQVGGLPIEAVRLVNAQSSAPDEDTEQPASLTVRPRRRPAGWIRRRRD